MSPPSATSGLGLEGLPRVGVGIRIKLIGLMVAMSVAIVGPLASYLPKRELEEQRSAAHLRAEVFAGLASQQLRSAVAFADRETAREVLSAIAKDPLIDSATVYTSDGRELHGEGKRSELARRAGSGISDKPVAFYLPGRILAAAPIQSLEGERGTVVLELSTRPLREMQQRLTLAALWIGIAALGLGAVLAWLIARSLARRIETIADAASAMSRGELSRVVAVSGPHDELGVLSHGFNAMSRKVSELVDHIQRTAREESARLERLVSKRTDQLNTKNRDLRLVLDNVEQGFVTIDRDGLVVGEYSLAIRTWLGELDRAADLWSQLTHERPRERMAFQIAWEQVAADLLPLETTLDQMPRRLELSGRYLSLEYRALGGQPFERLLVVMSDVTATVAREASEQESRDLINVTTRLLKDRQGFFEFFDETQRLLGRLTKGQTDVATLKRDLHTLKGNSLLYGLSRLAAVCHRLESELDEQNPDALERSALTRCWEQYASTISRMSGERDTTTIAVAQADHAALLDAVLRDAPKHEIVRALRAWRLEPLRARLERVAEQLVSTAAQLGKGSVAVRVQTQDVYLGREELSEFWAAFSHVIRNAAVHGLSDEASRLKSGKVADFDLLAGIEQNRLFVELADTGPGIDWEGIRRRARARGIPHGTQAELDEALFVDGISTRLDLDELAGRGVGLSAVRAACVRRHGSVRVKTAHGAGTSFRFSWPTSQFQSLVELDGGGLS